MFLGAQLARFCDGVLLFLDLIETKLLANPIHPSAAIGPVSPRKHADAAAPPAAALTDTPPVTDTSAAGVVRFAESPSYIPASTLPVAAYAAAATTATATRKQGGVAVTGGAHEGGAAAVAPGTADLTGKGGLKAHPIETATTATVDDIAHLGDVVLVETPAAAVREAAETAWPIDVLTTAARTAAHPMPLLYVAPLSKNWNILA